MTETHSRGSSDSSFGSEQRNRSRGNGRERHSSWEPDGRTRERLRGFANRQKDIGVEKMSGLADAAHKAAKTLAEQNAGLADLVHDAADGLDRASENLRERDVSEIYRSVNDFARRQPLTFLACSVAAGILLSRFLKSSSGGTRRVPGEQDYHPSPNL